MTAGETDVFGEHVQIAYWQWAVDHFTQRVGQIYDAADADGVSAVQPGQGPVARSPRTAGQGPETDDSKEYLAGGETVKVAQFAESWHYCKLFTSAGQ